ncbi:MAG: hypothetical protein UU77_C0035G0004 [candidate division WWE3 bacterium GW2011_GWC1_41_7]|uniref:DUF5673 domain-containing protein n=4 Tax=Katanobacteria TaxID=422282 RepID=A0A0G1A3J7_UNCKA|nr:MAG: hypothetical protein UU72_C0009G0005 [candidate division WWE3 bacterium GW2011_GWB1_41_6]KKS19953.1 MAG: hypothetical protein UU77_C0035G0004 [candidate division WWE3 bacterium GW2011_GWC1_41_7]KKS22484.1 MAG: hypothetical protein UU80_C0006G0010 [candidate division WWE3 bacterium GW2011_GWA1_41_8]
MKLTDVTNYMGITNVKQPEPPVEEEFHLEDQAPKEVYLSWNEANRPEKKPMNHRFVRTFTVIGIVIALFLAIMGEFFLILLIASIIFISYALSITPPESIKYEVSSHGLEVADKIYHWRELKHFFITARTEREMLAVDTKERLPGRLFVVFNHTDKERLIEIFSQHLPHIKEEPMNVADKAMYSLMDKLNFEDR